MEKRKCLYLLIFTLISLNLFAQQGRVEIKGDITDRNAGKSIEQATIRLLNLNDSTLVDGSISSRNGNFSIKNIRPGNYLLHISFIGFEPLYQPLQITGSTNPVHLGKLVMSEDNILLNEAIVLAQVPEVVVNNDTIEFNADAFKVAEGSMLEDLLKKMPGVEVDKEGAITINGKEIKKVLVDGKEFFSDDPKVASKNLPAKMIEKVQTYEKKSDMTMLTGFDDGEEEDVINLVVRQGMKNGWFGNVLGGYGNKDRYEGNALLNRFINQDMFTVMGGLNNTGNEGFTDRSSGMFSGMSGGGGNSGGRNAGGGRGGGNSRASGGSGSGNGITSSGSFGTNIYKEFSKKFSINGNFQYSHSDRDARSSSLQENIFPNDSSTYEDSRSQTNTISNNYTTGLRMEWKPDDKTTLIFTPRFTYSQRETLGENESFSYDNRGERIYKTGENSFSRSNGYNLNAGLTFSRKLNEKGRVVTISLTGGYNDRDNKGDHYSETNYYRRAQAQSEEIIDQIYNQTQDGHNYRANISWVEPLGKNNFLQVSYNISRNKQESIKNTYTLDGNELYTVLDTAYSKSYENDFITQRISLRFQARREKYRYTIGLNADPSYSHSRTFVRDETLSDISRRVVNFSPTATFDYLWDRRTNLRISYNGSTSQPSISQLQPVSEITNATNTTVGNPDLKPTYTNQMSVRYQKYSQAKQSMLMVSGNMSYLINAIVRKTTYDDDGSGKRTTTYDNVNGNLSSTVRVSYNSPFRNRKFTFNTMTSVGYSQSNGFVNGEENVSHSLNLQERAGLNFRSDYIDLSVNFNVRMNDIGNSLQDQNDQTTWNYGTGGSTTIYLPYKINLESDIAYSANSGYSDGYEQKETLWNASLSKSFLKGNQAMLRFRYYDILQKRSNINRTVTASYIRDSEYNTLTSYFMVHFIYRFSVFAGGATRGDMRRGPGGRGGRPDGGQPRGGGGSFRDGGEF